MLCHRPVARSPIAYNQAPVIVIVTLMSLPVSRHHRHHAHAAFRQVCA